MTAGLCNLMAGLRATGSSRRWRRVTDAVIEIAATAIPIGVVLYCMMGVP